MARETVLGYSVPEVTDTGAVLVETLAEAIERLARHTHSGGDSLPVTVTSIPNETQVLTGADLDWSAARDADGLYKATITLPVVGGGSQLNTRERTISFFLPDPAPGAAAGTRLRALLEHDVFEGDGATADTLEVRSNVKHQTLIVKYA